MSAGAGGEQDLALLDAHVARIHDLVGGALFEDAILMNAAGVSEGVGAHDGFVGLDQDAGPAADHPARFIDLLSDDAGLAIVEVAARLHRHDDLFQAGVSGPLADAVDGTLHLARPTPHRCQGVRDRQAQVVVAVRADDGFVYVWNVFHDITDQIAVLFGGGIAGRVGDIDDRCARLDDRFDHLAEVLFVGAARILQEVLYVIHIGAGVLDRLYASLHRLLAAEAQFVLEVAVGDPQPGMDTGANGLLERLARHIDVLAYRPRQTAHRAVLDEAADGLDGLEVTRRGDGKSRLDDVHAEALQLPGDLQFLLDIQGSPRRLLPIAQCGVKDKNA